MSDLMSNIVDFDKLKSKYSGFSDPVISLSVISKSDKDKFIITDLHIELSCEFGANIATVKVYGVFDNTKKKFTDDVFNKVFQIGKKININIGYGASTECVFSGFISGLTYVFSAQELPHIVLECLDVKAIMMASNSNTQITQDTYEKCISDIVGKAVYKTYYKSAKVDSNIKSPKGDDRHLIEMTDESDYDFIVRIAKKQGYEFFVSQETLYFRKKRAKPEPIMTISHKDVVTSLEASYDISGMVGKVEIRSLSDKDGELIKASSKSGATYSNSSLAAKIANNAIKVIVDQTVTSDSEARMRADVELDNIAWNFGTFFIETIGVPDFIPGRFIKIKDMSADINKKIYIVKVTHDINDEGFKTSLEARIDSL